MVPDHADQAVADLTSILSLKTLSDRERDAGQRLLRRISCPVQVALHGPDLPTAKAILSSLRAIHALENGATEFTLGGQLDDADIVIWCTKTFTATEREAWSIVPNALKDHSFLVVCAPQADHLQHLEDVAVEEFIAFHHLPTSGETVELRAMQCNLAEQIQSGVQAVKDSAHLFVQKYRARMPATQQPTAARPLLIPEKPVPQNVTPKVAETVFQKAMSRLCHHVNALPAHADGDPSDICQNVFQVCCNASEDLVEVFTTGSSNHPEFASMRDIMHDATDNIMLMSLENDLNSAVDAVTVLLQVRKDLSVCLASGSL